MNQKCPFCQGLADNIALGLYFSAKEKNRRDDIKDLYKIALVKESYFNGHPTGSITFTRREFSFCPICGREIGDINDAAVMKRFLIEVPPSK